MGNKFLQEVELIIGGEKRLFKFGTNATAVYCSTRNVKLSEVEKELDLMSMDIEKVRDFIYAGLVAGCYRQGKEITFNKYNVGDWIDEMEQGELEKAFGVVGTPVERGTNYTKKKPKRK